MPLEAGKSEEIIQRNIAELIKAGHKPDQAAAIAYKKARGEDVQDDDTGETFRIYDAQDESARKYDLNGWAEVKGNPISKVGVFDYLGRDISPDFEPERIYKVYRPAEELSSEETIESFKLLPWTDEHAMLGDGMMAAERKGIHGVIGEDVYFEDGYLKANLKIFSEKLASLIDQGKKELSIGYRCLYDIVSGVYDGVRYDAIQRNIRGNHLASVDEGRSGHDVAVLDHFKITFDSKEIQMAESTEKEAGEMTLADVVAMVKEIAAKVDAIGKSGGDESEEVKKELSEEAAKEGDAKDAEGEYNKFVNKANITDKDLDEQKSEKVEDENSEEEEEMSQDKGMDAAVKKAIQEISRRDSLASRLSDHIGTFDHKDKTFAEVARYGVKALRLNCEAGHEASMLEGYLAAAKVNTVSKTAADSVIKSDSVDAFLKGGE